MYVFHTKISLVKKMYKKYTKISLGSEKNV